MRPAIAPLFRSAAYSAGSAVIGVVLSSLWTVEQFGGTAIV